MTFVEVDARDPETKQWFTVFLNPAQIVSVSERASRVEVLTTTGVVYQVRVDFLGEWIANIERGV